MEQFFPAEQQRCTRLTTLGGSPSYVEMLTCLEMAQAAKKLPADDKLQIPYGNIQR